MKKMRLLAWLLVIAMLSLTCTALGEGLNVEMTDDTANLPAELELEVGGDAPDLLDPDALSVELPELDLSGNLSTDLSDGADGLEGNDSPRDRAPVRIAVEGGANDGLFGGYVDLLFGKHPVGDLRANGFIGDTLTGKVKKVYDYLEKQIKKVAAGQINSTVFRIPTSIATVNDYEELDNDFTRLHIALLTDLPYHLYWYAKTIGVYMGTEDGEIYFMFSVAEAYADKNGDFYVNPENGEVSYLTTIASRIKAAQVAVTNAKKVVRKYAGVSDYKKLCGYRDYICSAVDYNNDAVDSHRTDDYDWNAWQLIWAFDGDSSTDIVCEGYSKAFQYLCDLTSFNTAIQSHIVYGTEYHNGDGGAHMWNIVTMGNGKNYHVDVTFVDGGYTAAFLCGAAQTEDANTYLVRNELHYQLDSDIVALYPAKTLKLSTRDFDPDNYDDPTKVKPTKVTITQGKSATLYMGNKLTLKAKLTPSNATAKLTWKSGNKAVATVSAKGVVTPKKAGSAVITVKTDNGRSAKITVKVVDASSVKLKKGTTTLKKGQSIKLARGKSLTLKGVVSPAKVKTKLTWTSSNKYVTVKNGKVTVNRNAKVGTKAKITVKTANKKSTYIYIVVK